MNNGDLYSIVLAVLKKEGRGNIVKPDRFSEFLLQTHHEYYNQQYEKWSSSQAMVDSLRPFLVLDEAVSLTSGSAALSTLDKEYKHASSARLSLNGKVIDIVTPIEWNSWAGDVLMQGKTTDPLVTIDSTSIKVLPVGVTSILFTYLKEVDDEPFMDYYLDANYNVQYLEVDEEYTLQAGEVYRDGTDSGTVTSLSIELEWGDQDKVNIITVILEKLGVSLQAPDVTQYAMALEQKQNVV